MPFDPARIRLGNRKRYSPVAGDEWVEVGNLGPAHTGRVFEARNETGEGYLGRIVDAEHHLLQGTVGIRFEGERLGLFGPPTAQIILKPLGTDPEAEPGDGIAEATFLGITGDDTAPQAWLVKFIDGETQTIRARDRADAIRIAQEVRRDG